MAHDYDHEYMHEHNIPHDHDHDPEHAHQGGASHEHSHEHVHTHEHEHTHADGTTHSHPHEHAHTHEHEHGHGHGHDHGHSHGCPSAGSCNADCASCDVDPRAELMALMQYMVNHNASHANELAQLAQRLRDMGEDIAFEQVMQAVSDFEKGNMRLSTVLAAMNPPKQ